MKKASANRLKPFSMKKERADRVLVSRGLAETRQKAQALIMAGLVYSGEKRIEKPGQMIPADLNLSLKETIPYVSRGGLKLAEALEVFRISVKDKVAADLGASTGGFTDCLLQKGARMVYAVDVDINQLDWRLREDSRVVCIKKNARYLTGSDFDRKPEIVTMDLSFISVLKVLPAVRDFLGDGQLISLIKPQFEAGKGRVGKKGIVRDPAIHQEVLNKTVVEAQKMGFGTRGVIRSSTRGQKGNREFFLYLTLTEEPLSQDEVRSIIKEAVGNEKD
jgi:23S rRNA (cytidine1920-2'-O)/16S rRNA (cytidine1409-2'-O)-methyltransferase